MFQQLPFDRNTTRSVRRRVPLERRDLASRLVARKIIALARGGERDRARLCGDGRAPA